MDLSVVVPTLNGRDRLAGCLDALSDGAPSAEVVVVNGPSSDGTSGFVRDHAVVDELVEVADRNLNAARNAGIAATEGDAVALVGDGTRVDAGWGETVRDALAGSVAAITGPVRDGETSRDGPETRSILGREVTYFEGDNVALTRDAIRALDGFDEYLVTGGARDAAHRLAGQDRTVGWHPGLSTVRSDETDVVDRTADVAASEWAVRYRSLSYRLVKNYGLRPSVGYRVLRHAVADGWSALLDVVRGDGRPSEWAGGGRDVLVHGSIGVRDGWRARREDRTPRRNPNGLSTRMDRAVARYD